MPESDEKNYVRLVPVYHLNVCEPIYIGAHITNESVKQPGIHLGKRNKGKE